MASVTKINGRTLPGAFYGLTPRMFTVTMDAATFDVAAVDGIPNYTLVNSTFEEAVRAINSVASIIILGTPTATAFTVVVDNSFDGRGSDAAAVVLKAAIEASVTGAAVATVAEVSLQGAALA